MVDRDQNKTVEQLWYTWSDVGLDTLRAGARIRAASEGLQDLRSARVQSLDRYQRYSLPSGADPTISVLAAPICLSLIATGRERILVHKVYTGRDGVGRYGAFFVHLLAGLPEYFSAHDAISLWQSDFWQRSDVPRDRQNTRLEYLSLETLWSLRKDITLNSKSIDKIREYLPYVIEAYLTKKPVTEAKTRQQVPQKIYLAGPDHEIAQLICGLTLCLPVQLLNDLTFSTYERDVTEATTEIIGTCWLSIPEAEKDPYARRLLLDEYNQKKLTLNCYTGKCTDLQDHPLVENKPLATKFARDATTYFTRKGTEEFMEMFSMLLDMAAGSDVDGLVSLYESLIMRRENPVKFLLLSADYTYIARNLAKPVYPRALISLALHDADWWWTMGKPAIIRLGQASTKIPLLAQGLHDVAQVAIARIVAIVKREVPPSRSLAMSETAADEESMIRTLIDVMLCAVPPAVDATVWRDLLHKLVISKDIFAFLSQHWSIYTDLMRLWSALPPLPKHSELMRPLFPVSWSMFGEFLALRLRADWNEEAIKVLLSQQAATLSEKRAYGLAQHYHPQIIDLFQQFVQVPQWWPTVRSLFDRLTEEGKYPKKLDLLLIMLDSPMAQHQENVVWLLAPTRLTTVDEQAYFLEHYGPHYLPLNNTLSKIVLRMFGTLAENNDRYAQQQKIRVLTSWLEAPQLSAWLDAPSIESGNLATILQQANLTVQEGIEFFQHYGQKYIVRYPTSLWLLNLFDSYARSGAERRLYYLAIWLDQDLDQETLERVLAAAHLTAQEKGTFLKRYGGHYLLRSRQSDVLSGYVQEFIEYLGTVNIEIFKEKTSARKPSATEDFLHFLYKNNIFLPLKQIIHDWYFTTVFMRKHSLFEQRRSEFAESIGRILRLHTLSRETYGGLMKELARTCIGSPAGFSKTIAVMHRALTPPDLMYLIGTIAELVRDGIQRKRYKNPLLVVCILFAFYFRRAFNAQVEQDYFLRSFLDMLLQDVDWKTLNWLTNEAKKWPEVASLQWQDYMSQSPVVGATFSGRVELWWERTIALLRMRFALRSKDIKKIVQVATEEMTTLISDDVSVPDDWWGRINEAITAYNAYEERSHLASTRLMRFPQWWQRTIAFTQIWLALRSRRIGKIVRVVTEQVNLVERYQASVPSQWWRQIDVAFDFFIACEDGYQDVADERWETAIVTAGEKLDGLYEAKHPAPLLTFHEIKRREAARHSRKVRGTLKGWTPATLLPPDVREEHS